MFTLHDTTNDKPVSGSWKILKDAVLRALELHEKQHISIEISDADQKTVVSFH